MKTFVFDVMLNGRFVCTLKYKYCQLFPIDAEDLTKFVLKKRPTLKGKNFRIVFLDMAGFEKGKKFDVYPFTDNNVCNQIVYIKYVHQLQHLLFGLGHNSEMEV